jgi:hypothetical protein
MSREEEFDELPLGQAQQRSISGQPLPEAPAGPVYYFQISIETNTFQTYTHGISLFDNDPFAEQGAINTIIKIDKTMPTDSEIKEAVKKKLPQREKEVTNGKVTTRKRLAKEIVQLNYPSEI